MSEKQPIVCLSRAIPGDLDIPGADIRVLGENLPTRKKVLDFVHNSALIVASYTDRIDDQLLDAAGPGLLGIVNYGVGLDNIDLPACRRRGLPVANTPDAVTEGTANHAWLLTLSVARKLVEADRYARSPAYSAGGLVGMCDFLGKDLAGRTLLIVGAGRIGYATALRARAWSMRTLYVARSRHPEFEGPPLRAHRVSLENGLEQADVVSIHTPLTPDTHHLIGRDAFARMKPGAILVNTARGPIVDENALIDALQSCKLWGAGLDVHEHEPKIAPRLIARTDVVLTPHIGSAEIATRERMTAMVSANARAILAGDTPPNLVQDQRSAS